MYSKEAFINDCRTTFNRTGGNTVEIDGIGELTIYEMPLIGFAAADDEIFERFRQPEIIGSNYFTPSEWLPSAKTVAAFFFPFTEKVRVSNRKDRTDPSVEWLYGRVEGQAFIAGFMSELARLLNEKGIDACVPSQDGRFGIEIEMTSSDGTRDLHVDSRWSERHAAYACGLGTFGMSRGLITEKGVAGRYASVIVSEEWQADERRYTGIDDYCVQCGACARNCPAKAISPEYGKNNIICKAYVDKMKVKYDPRYGCGKCQVGVPCEFRAPGMKVNMR